ncbi:MAG: ATP-binding cassette domain-containing protein [Bacteroidia bacterium]|nr:ATP-binding cassette domain-containing protein [Bacteroidia bacterium]
MKAETQSIDKTFYQQHADGEEIIAIKGLQKSFGDNHVLRGFNLSLKKGENIVILGKSGCGKSILIKCIVGLIRYDAGSLEVLGNEIKDLSHAALDELRMKIGFVFQNSALYDSMTVRKNLEFPLRRHKLALTPNDIQDLVKETLQNVGLLHAIDLMPSELSGGMRKRIGLARALVLNPEIVLYDEPTTGLDPISSKEIITLMLNTQKQYNTSSIIISHDMHCARLTGNRLAVMSDGICYAEGNFENLKSSSDPVINSFFL